MAKKKTMENNEIENEEILEEEVEFIEEQKAEEITALIAENENLKQETETLKETAQRIQAEFENYRRRSLNDLEQTKVRASSAIVAAILPGLDSMDEAIKVYSEKNKEMAEGFEKIQKQLLDSLSSAGVNPMDCLDKEFDPNLHEAVMMQECEEKPSGTIINVFRKGYTYNDAVIRHAQVIVAK